jgi:hypothetical protein
MKFVLISILLLSMGCSLKNTEDNSYSELKEIRGGRVGEFKGYEALNLYIIDHFFDLEVEVSRSFHLGVFIGAYRDLNGIATILGGFSGDGVENDFRNGKPNGMNTAVWKLAVKRFVYNLVDCASPDDRKRGHYKISRHLRDLIVKTCQWPQVEKPYLTDLWTLLMGYQAPKSERDAWMALYLDVDSPFKEETGEDTLRAMIMTIMLNPYFMLNQ